MSEEPSWVDKYNTPIPLKAGDKRILINGCPPKVDFRVVAEKNYSEMASEISRLKERINELENILKSLRYYDIDGNNTGLTLYEHFILNIES